MASEGPALTAGLFIAGCAAFFVAALILWSNARPHMDWPLAIFLAFVSLVIVAGWLGTILASIGSFSLITLGLSVWVLAVVIVVRFRRRLRLFFAAPTRYELGLAFLLVGCSLVYFRPHEYVLGATDAGTYMNISSTLAKTGQFVITNDDWSRFLREFPAVTLRQQPAVWQTRYLQFVGYYLDDADAGRIIPQFFPFHPVLIAIGTSLGGLPLGLLVTPVWGILSIAAIYFVTRQIFDRLTALLSATLLALTPTHIYFARYPTAEPLTLLLVFSGLLACQQLQDDRAASRAWGLFGGAAFGAALLTRIDLPLVLVLIALALVVVRVRGRWTRSWMWFTIALGVFVVHVILDVVFINWPYAWNTYGGAVRLITRSPILIVAGVIGLLVFCGVMIFVRRKWHPRSISASAQNKTRWAVAIGLVALSAFAYFIRPALEPIRFATAWPGNVQYPVLDGQNWVRMGWYLTPLGIVLTTLGAAWIVRRESVMRVGLFLSIGLLTTIQYVYNIFNTSYHIYAMRRYVPIVIPMLMIYAAVACVAVWRWRRHWFNRSVALVLALGLIAGLIYQSRFVLPQREFFGATDRLAQLNAQLAPNAIIVFNEKPESSLADAFGVPLRFTFDHDVATIRSEDETAVTQFLNQLLARARQENRPVQLLAIDPISPAVRNAIDLQPVGSYSMTLSTLKGVYYEYPAVQQPAFYGFEIYEVDEKRSSVANESIDIDIGTLDTAYIRSGFYSKEVLPDGSSARWTTDHAIIDVPVADSSPITIEVRALIFHPDDVPVPDVIVALDGHEIGHFQPLNGAWQTFAFRAAPQPINGRAVLEFRTKSFNPARLNLSADDRDLGFMLDRVRISH